MFDVTKNLLKDFFAQLKEDLQTLQTAVNDKDFNQIYQIGHSLKGASISLCLDKLAHLFEEIEIEGKNKKLDNTNKIIAELLAFSNKY